MDRRIVLAMVLAVAVLVVNQLVFAPKHPTPPQVPGSADTAVVMEPPVAEPLEPAKRTEDRRGVGAGTIMLRDPAAVGDTTGVVRVETRLVSAEFDPVGGALRSWKLLDYTDREERPADLVRAPGVGALWLAFRDGSRVIRTDSTRFQTNVERGGSETLIRFTAEDPSGVRLTKTYRLASDRYDCGVEIAVEGIGESSGEGVWEFGWVAGLPTVERDPRSDYQMAAAVALFGKEYIRTGAGGGVLGCAGGGNRVKSESHEGTLRWLGVRNKYFLGAILLEAPRDRRIVTGFDPRDHSASAVLQEPLSMSGRTEQRYRLYLGPIDYTILTRYGVELERVQDLGPGILRPFSKLLMKFFIALNKLVPNYGLEILILSILLRFVFYPLTKKSMQSMKRMQQLKPEMERISARYKNDAERKNREIMELYRKNKINPLGGCIPLLIQLPVLSGLYYVLANAVQLRKEPFAFWIRDLSAPDTVAAVAGFPVNVLPLVMAGTMVWQQKITPTDPRQASLGYIMPIFMTFLFYSTPSGLVLYWTVSNLLTVLQQIWMNRGASQHDAVLVLEEQEPQKGARRRRSAKGR